VITRRPIIGVMGSHESEWELLAEPLGKMIAEFGYHLLTGAGAGVMTAASRGFASVKTREGICIGIIPTLDSQGQGIDPETFSNPYVEIPVVTPLGVKALSDSMPFSRNNVNIMTANAVIILPGSHGTKNEASLCIQYEKPFIYYGPMEAFEGFPEQRTRVSHIDSVREFLEQVQAGFYMEDAVEE
jgi:uncharacterized protein (TIGR00725 family)